MHKACYIEGSNRYQASQRLVKNLIDAYTVSGRLNTVESHDAYSSKSVSADSGGSEP